MNAVANAVLEAPAASEDLTAEDLAALKKRNFLRFPVEIDAKRLIEEYSRIPDSAWGVSYWDVHCSIDVLLLRGGAKGDADDFITPEVKDNPILDQLPYIGSLIRPEGPFGGAVYAFIFKTKPNGITRIHRDGEAAWRRATRIHMPIITNPGAFLLAEGRAKHLKVGEAWTFDNQSLHSVVNGDETRVHLIIDINPNPKLVALMRAGVVDPGEPDPERWAMTRAFVKSGSNLLKFAKDRPLTIAEKQGLGLPAEGFATRVTQVSMMGRALGAPIKAGDIVLSVDGVTKSAQARSALDHMRIAHKPWTSVTVEIIRGGRTIKRRVRLWPGYVSPHYMYVHVKKLLKPGAAANEGY